jgi:hypothetical protein
MGFIHVEPQRPEKLSHFLTPKHQCLVGSREVGEPDPNYGPGSRWQCDACGIKFVYRPHSVWWGWLLWLPVTLIFVVGYNMVTFGLRSRGGEGWWMLRGVIGASLCAVVGYVGLTIAFLRGFDII